MEWKLEKIVEFNGLEWNGFNYGQFTVSSSALALKAVYFFIAATSFFAPFFVTLYSNNSEITTRWMATQKKQKEYSLNSNMLKFKFNVFLSFTQHSFHSRILVIDGFGVIQFSVYSLNTRKIVCPQYFNRILNLVPCKFIPISNWIWNERVMLMRTFLLRHWKNVHTHTPIDSSFDFNKSNDWKLNHLRFNGIQRTVEQWSLQKRFSRVRKPGKRRKNTKFKWHNYSISKWCPIQLFTLRPRPIATPFFPSFAPHTNLQCKYVSSSLFTFLRVYIHTIYIFLIPVFFIRKKKRKEKRWCVVAHWGHWMIKKLFSFCFSFYGCCCSFGIFKFGRNFAAAVADQIGHWLQIKLIVIGEFFQTLNEKKELNEFITSVPGLVFIAGKKPHLSPPHFTVYVCVCSCDRIQIRSARVQRSTPSIL